jgi:hypothetical protein
MKIYSDNIGALIRVLKTLDEEDRFGAPGVYTYELEIDPATNAPIVEAIDTDWNNTTLIGTEVRLSGVLLPVNPPGTAWIERLREEAAETTVSNIPGWATWTEAEALAWHDTNIRDPIEDAPTVTSQNAVQVLQGVVDMLRIMEDENRALVQIALAMRNKLWPNLEGS